MSNLQGRIVNSVEVMRRLDSLRYISTPECVPKMLKVGLTGSIAVGKSFVLSVLAELGGHVFDADEIAREVVQPGTKGLKAVCDAFGEGVVNADGTLNRARLGSIVFADEAKRTRLNNLLHPLIIAVQDDRIRELQQHDPGGIVIIDAALMIESGGFRRLDKLIVVHCRPEIQLQRLMLRDGLSREAAEQRINSQMPQEQKKKYADFLIDTSVDFDSTRAQVKAVYEQLQRISR
ncbi:MAG TPA: dephospho-CoA kinase [Pyrinomonadaceae bacterium]|nr:dephospho-CoA kinase [Pyrinomonadaceae bacterium]